MKKLLALALCLSLGVSAAPAKEEYKVNDALVVRVTCKTEGGTIIGSAVKIGVNKYITAAHVVTQDNCEVGGVTIQDVKRDAIGDFASFTGPSSKEYFEISCDGFKKGKTYFAMGYGNGEEFKSYMPWQATPIVEEGFQTFYGDVLPGMSGGAVIDSRGRVVGVVNMRWPVRGRALKEELLCGTR